MATSTPAYRDALEGARIRYAELLALVRADTSLTGAAAIFAARTGRIYAGATGIAGAALLALAAAATTPQPPLLRVQPTTVLLASWPAMGAAYALGRILGARRMNGTTAPPRTGDIHADLARLERRHPAALVRELATKLEWASVALPMMAVALLAPLTLHYLVSLLFRSRDGFDDWIRMSLVIVGHAHVVLAALYWRFAGKASRLSSEELLRKRSRMEWSTLGITVGVSAVPGAVLMLLPPLYTALTGLVFNPILFRLMTRTIVAERWRLV